MRVPTTARIVAAAALLLAAGQGLPAQTAPAIRFSDTTLDNGLRVIISEDHSAPVYSIAVHYKVGSKDERIGRTGFAHLFEHMMFKGSENVGPGEHFMLIFTHGGTMNGTTNKDRTLYFETLPSNQLDLGIYLEADRMKSLSITKENLDNQRNAVQEERRLGLDNQPYGRTDELIDELAYDNPAYEHSVIGSMADLNAASVEDVASFFKTYYAPNNAVVAIVGDVNTATALEKVRKAFGSIPSQPQPPRPDLTEPPQRAERRQTITDALARLPRVDIVFKVPPRLTPDDNAVQVLGTVLSSGRSSRLYQQVIREQQLSPNIFAGRDGAIGPGLFRVSAPVSPGKTPEATEKAILAEIEKLKTASVEQWEIDKARANAKRGVVSGLTSSLQRSIQLAEFAAEFGDPALINRRVERITSVTPADVQRIARNYFTAENRTVVITVPKGAGSQGGAQ
ncbi:MAG TPA: pitrilysin family protein [Vicinamibacterales bacterium]|nr:pitrilysin family protein [Vicinamibacterales bacterium]